MGGGVRGAGRGGRGNMGGGGGGTGQPPRMRRRLLIRTSDSSSEEEFIIPTNTRVRNTGVRSRSTRVRTTGVRQYPDYVGRRVSVPDTYFRVNDNKFYGGVCNRWGRYRNGRGEYSYGYYIHFDEGDKYWMIESDVHSYIIQE